MEEKTYTAQIYKITCSCCNKIYVGSCRQRKGLSGRMYGHRAEANRDAKDRNSKLYIHMREQGYDKFNILLLETVEVNNIDEQRKREQEKIEELDTINNGLNERRAYQSIEVKKQLKKISDAKYCKNNRETINEMVKIYRHNLPKSYICVCCNYTTQRKDTYDRHCKGGRHLKKATKEIL
jgi:hypothetical protein